VQHGAHRAVGQDGGSRIKLLIKRQVCWHRS
jgi:hypothetical protein